VLTLNIRWHNQQLHHSYRMNIDKHEHHNKLLIDSTNTCKFVIYAFCLKPLYLSMNRIPNNILCIINNEVDSVVIIMTVVHYLFESL
jgi:hypothetical protein